MEITLENCRKADEQFIKDIYYEFKSDQLGFTGELNPIQRIILNQQYSAQENYYSSFKEKFCQFIIFYKNQKAGRFIIIKDDNNWHLADIIISSEFRNKGIAKSVLKKTIEKAQKENVTVSGKVDKSHTIIKFYKSLGFEIVEDEGMEYLMKFNFKKKPQ